MDAVVEINGSDDVVDKKEGTRKQKRHNARQNADDAQVL